MSISKNYNDSIITPKVSSAIDVSPLNYYNTSKFETPASGNSLKDRILSLRDTGSKLLSDSRIADGLDCYTTMFNVLSNMQDSNGAEFIKHFTESIEELNKIAMKYVQHNDTETGHQILTFCDETTQPVKYGNFPLQRTQTLNNIGCLYRRVGKLKGALNYLRSALMILNKNNLMEHSAVTYLNLSAVQAQMGDRQQAYQNARNALVYAQEEILLYQDHYDREKYKEKVVTLAIVYHNMGAEEEHLQNLKNALDYYEKAFTVMDEYGIFDEKLYHKFQTSYQAAQERFGSGDMQLHKRVVSPMSATGVTPSTKSHKQLFEALSATVSPRGVLFGPTKQTIAPNVEVHHRGSSLKTFQFKDKRIVSQPRLNKPPILSTTTPMDQSGQQPKMWSTMKSSASAKSVNPRPLYRERFTAYKKSEDGLPLVSRRPVNKSASKDRIDSKNSLVNEKEESHIDTDTSQAHYKVPEKVAKKQSESKVIEKSPVKEKKVKTEEEIKALEDMGVLDWSDSSMDTKRKREEKQAIKKNQKKFFSGLKNAKVTNLSGNFKLMDSSDSSSASSSSSSPRNASASKNKTKSSKKISGEQAQQESQSPQNNEGIVEEVLDGAEQVSEVIEDLNGSKFSRATSRAGDFTNKSEAKMFKDSKLMISPISKKEQAYGSKVARPSNFEKGSKTEMILASMQWGEFSGLHSKVVEPEQESIVSPRVVLTKEELKTLHKAQVKAVMFIQKMYKRRLLRERAKLILESKKMKANKVLIRKKWLIMSANKTVGDSLVEQEKENYSLNIFALPDRDALLFVLTESTTRLRYDAEESYASVELIKDQPVTSPFNNGILQQLCDDLIERMYIVDHLLLFKEKKKGDKGKDAKAQDDSSIISEEETITATNTAPINYKEHEDKIIKIQSRVRGNIARQKVQVMKSRNFKFLYREVIKVDEQLVRLRIIQYNGKQNVVITGVHLLSGNQFNKLEVPEKFMQGLGRKQDDIINKLEFDFNDYEITLLPSIEAELYPEKKQKAVRKFNIKDIIVIQKSVRRHLARKMYSLRLKKAKENPASKMMKKYVMSVNRNLFIVRIYHNKEQNHFTVSAKSSDYHADIKSLTIPIEEVDKNEFSDNMTNLKRLVDILVPYIKIEFTKAETFVLIFDKREYDRSTRRFESQLMNFNTFEMGNGEETVEEKSELQKKIWTFLHEKNFLETNKHIIKNFLGLQAVQNTVKIIEETDPGILNFAEVEDEAALKIQKFYRKILLRRYFNTINEKDIMSGNKVSASQILSNSVRSKSFSMFCEAYKRMTMPEEELHRQSTSEYSFIKSVSNIKFINTKMEAKAFVFSNKTNPKEKTIDVEVFMPLIGLHDYFKISESDVFQNSIKPSSFQKKVEEHLISKLEYNPISKKVVFEKDGIKASEAEMLERGKQTISSFIQAKLTRLKFLRRKVITKGMVPISVHTTDVDKLFIHMSSYWHPHLKQLRILLERIDDLTHHKDIIVKLDTLQNSKELKTLLNTQNINQEELRDKLKPYADYISKHILIQPDLKSSVNHKKDFKVMMDGSVFKIEFVNTRFILVSMKDLSEEALRDIAAKSAQANAKFSIKASKLVDVNQLEALFPKVIDLKDILEGDRKDQEGSPTDAIELLKKSERAETKDADGLKKSVRQPPTKMKAVLTLQRIFRGNTERSKYERLKSRKLAEAMKLQSFGVRVKKIAKKLDDNYWTITAYRKVMDENSWMYYFFASNMVDGEKPTKVQARGIFRADNMLILNSEGRELVDALLDRIEIVGQTIEFNMERDNFVKFGAAEEEKPKTREPPQEPRQEPLQEPEESKEQSDTYVREVKLDTEAFNAQAAEERREEKEKGGETIERLNSERINTEGGVSERESQKSSRRENESPVSTRRVMTTHESPLESARQYLEKKQMKLEQKAKKEPLPENLLNQKTEAQSNNLLLYNVYYNNDDAELKPAPNSLIAASKKDPLHKTRKESISLSTSNVVKISVDMKELKKYNPNLAPKSSMDLKLIGAELANSIQVNEKGQILVNNSKVNPNALKVLEKQLDVVENPDKDYEEESKNNMKKKILFKMTKVYGDKKYLLLINYIEKPSNLNNILSIVRKEDDQVYEEFELFIEVNVVCLSNNAIRPITWELSLKEAQELSDLGSTGEVAKFFAANIHLFGDQILLSTPFQPSTNYKNVMIMNENAIKMIQNRFRSKKFAKNFTRFRTNLMVNRSIIIARAVIAINNVSYHVLGYESKDQDLRVEAWSLMNYEKNIVIVSKKFVEKLYAKDKKMAFNSIFKFLRFELNKKKEYELVLKEKSMFDYLKNRGEM